MLNVVVVLQHINWEDDGGAHDPFLVTVDQDLFTELKGYDAGTYPSDAYELRGRLLTCPTPSLPCQIDAVFNIWHDF